MTPSVTIGGVSFHLPYAEEVRVLTRREYAELRADIEERQEVLVPIEVDEHFNVIDGHHRLRIAAELGLAHIAYRQQAGLSADEKQARANDLNVHRRQLSEEERTAREQARRERVAAGQAGGKSTRQIAEDEGVSQPSIIKAAQKSSRDSRLSPGGNGALFVTGRDGKEYLNRPRTLPRATFGDTTLAKRRADNRQALADLRRHAASLHPPTGQYQTIVMDPPWQVEEIDRDVRPNQVGPDYPMLSLAEIAALPVANLMPESGAHLYLWTTQKYLPAAFTLLETWGLRYLFTMVWHKPGGFQVVGLPQFNCEFVVVGRSGSVPFLDGKAFYTCFKAPRREHSRKPDEFYELVYRVSPGPRLDMFSREKREGFEQWGLEPDHFTADGGQE